MQSQVAEQSLGRRYSLRRHGKERRAVFRDESRAQLPTFPIRHVKRPARCVENTPSAFDDQAVEIVRPRVLRKGCTETMQKVEYSCLLELDLLTRFIQRRDLPLQSSCDDDEGDRHRDEQPKENRFPHPSINAPHANPVSSNRARL